VITHLHQAAGYPIDLLCDLLNYPRSSYYYGTHRRDDSRLCTTIREVQGRWPTYGYRRITQQLRREGIRVNSKRVRRLRRLLDLQAKIKAKKRHTTNSAHDFPRYPNLVQDLEVTYPDHVWVADITWVHLRREDVYLAVLMDVFTRGLRGWHLSRSFDRTLTCTALRRALRRHTPPAIHHSDQGVQYAATEYTDLLRTHAVQISMAEVGEAWQNGYAERLIRTIKEEEVNLSEYDDYHDALQQLGRFLDDVYMHKRIHSSLGYLTPVEFESLWLAQQAAAQVV
jgi:transposase InsO family protein